MENGSECENWDPWIAQAPRVSEVPFSSNQSLSHCLLLEIIIVLAYILISPPPSRASNTGYEPKAGAGRGNDF